MLKLYALEGLMLVFEVVDLFLYNRRNGLAGSKGRVSKNTLIAYKYALRPFVELLEARGKIAYKEINAADIRAYVEHINELMGAGKWSKSRWLISVKVLKGLFKFVETDEDCVEAGLKSFRSKLPVSGQFPRRDHIPSPQDLKQWKSAFKLHTLLGMRDWLMFCLLLETGVRRQELSLIELSHIQLENRTIYIPDGKTGSRTVTITETMGRNIRAYLKKRSRTKLAEANFLFASYKNAVPTPSMVTKVFAKLRKDKNLPYITPHTMRHAFCTYYLSRGGSTERLRNVTGHKTYTAMLHYMHLAKVGGDGQKEEMERVSPLKMLDER